MTTRMSVSWPNSPNNAPSSVTSARPGERAQRHVNPAQRAQQQLGLLLDPVGLFNEFRFLRRCRVGGFLQQFCIRSRVRNMRLMVLIASTLVAFVKIAGAAMKVRIANGLFVNKLPPIISGS